jgi:photosystem II stability/assembly factor-like uncharacterized protein
MVNNDEMTSEERDQQNQRLLLALRRMYDTRNEDAQSLERIRERLLRNSESGGRTSAMAHPLAPTRGATTMLRGGGRTSAMAKAKPHPPAPDHPRSYPGFREGWTWQRRLSTIAAALFVTLLVGSLIIVFNLTHHSSPSSSPGGGPATTGIPGKNMTPIIASNQAITSIHMIDATTGWALTAQAILYTTDGGTSWKDITPSQHALTPGSGAFFLTASSAWVAIPQTGSSTGVQVFRTTNAGQSWQSTLIQPNIAGAEEITFIDTQHGWLLSHQSDAASAETLDIFRTTNGGQTWTLVSSTFASSTDGPSPGHIQFGGAKSGIAFRDAMTGWVTGTSFLATYPLLYVTNDGGSNWRQQTLPLPHNVASGQLSIMPPTFFTANDGILPVKFDTEAASFLDVYVTHDGGQNWQPTSLLSAGAINRAPTIDFIDVSHGWATNGTILYATSNGGQSWIEVPTSQNFKNISSLDFVSSEVGWAIGGAGSNSTVLLKTVDGGHTWI